MTDERYLKAIDRDAPIALILAIICEVLSHLWHPDAAEWSSTKKNLSRGFILLN